MFKEDEKTGDKTALASMNDKCASGTGATIDKCFLKVARRREVVTTLALRRLEAAPRRRQVRRVRRDGHRQPGEERHPVDRDPLLARRRDRHAEPLRAHARQHAEGARCCCSAGRTRTCRSSRSAGACASRRSGTSAATTTRRTCPIEELIFVPENAQYYAALRRRAVRPARGRRRRLATAAPRGLDEFITNGRKARLGETRGPAARRRTSEELDEFRELYKIPKFDAGEVRAGPEVVRGVIGLDGGSTSSKAVLVDYEDGKILGKAYQLSKGNPIQDTKELLAQLKAFVTDQGADARGHGLRRDRLRRRRARGVREAPT